MLYDYIIIGAGAAGLFFAATRKNSGPVLLLDRQERAGRKLLLSGGGKCNITNRSVSPENYLGQNPLFTRQALEAFKPEDMLKFLSSQRILLEDREHGQVFCRCGAEFVRDLLYTNAQKNGAEFRLGKIIKSVKRTEKGKGNFSEAEGHLGQSEAEGHLGQSEAEGHLGQSEACFSKSEVFATGEGRFAENEARFAVELDDERYFSRNLLVACGGPAWPRAGSTYLGKKIAQDFGHSYIAPSPALTPLKMPENWPLHGLQGISLNVTAKAPQGPAFTLPLLFTHNGISGPACLQVSSYLQAAQGVQSAPTSSDLQIPCNLRASSDSQSLHARHAPQTPHNSQASPGAQGLEKLTLNFLPEVDLITLLDAPTNGKQTPAGLLRRQMPERLAVALFATPECASFKDRKCAELSRNARSVLAAAVHNHTVTPLLPDFWLAESSNGGIDTSEVNPKTMESRLVPGLYFAGEVLDVCGQLGGYNLHWAWASANAVGRKV